VADVGGRDDDRGQMIIVLSVALAVMLVTMALLLNTAIFTENLATREGDIVGASGALSYEAAAADATGTVLTEVNFEENGTGHSDMKDAVERDVANWSDANNRLEATRGRSANVSVAEQFDGVRIVQHQDRNFTNESGEKNWTVASNVSGVRKYEMNVTTNDLENTTVNPAGIPIAGGGDPAKIRFNDGGDVWVIQIYNNTTVGVGTNTDVNLTVTDPGGTAHGPCAADGTRKRALLNVTAAEWGSEPCEPLEFVFDNLSNDFTITYNDTLNSSDEPSIEGGYELIVNTSSAVSSVDSSDYGPEGSSDHPYTTDAIYAVELSVHYETERLRYVTEVTVAPGAPE